MPGKNALFTYTPEAAEFLTFAWEGGAYIDVWPEGSERPTDTINVWDYEKDVPTIARTPEAFRAECDEWLASQD
ncbi:MAG: hypothetical protein ACTHON_18315 [Humibacter sp.]